MNKKFKKISSVALCAAMLTVVAPSVTSFADSITPGKSVHAEYKSEKRKITGTIDLSDYVLVEGVATTEDGNKIFRGKPY